jgi:hypothetical protein
LNASSSLEYLNLHSTKVSDASIPALKKLGTLRKLYLWNAPLTPEGVERLKRPGLHVVYQ